jgi:dihydrolipoamide dehydrogenase
MTSDSALFIDKVPGTMCIIGGGIVGMEFASLFGRFGTKVTVLEGAPMALPSLDEECAKELIKSLRKQNVAVEAGVTITAVEESKDSVVVKLKGAEDRKFDRVLVSVGRAPVTEDLGLDKVGITTDRGYIKTDSHYLTAVPNIFAIGDILTTPALAHTATAEAVHAAEVIAGLNPKAIDYQTNPNAVYTYPEVASVGMTEKELREKGIEYKIGKFPFLPMAKAKIEDSTEGFVKILFDPVYHELLGVHIVGAKATEMIGEFVLGKLLETTVDEIGRAIHPHPTLSEASMEAAHAALGHAIHG